MKTIHFKFLILFTFTTQFSLAQQPTEQDCLGSIFICDSITYVPYVYTGSGYFPNEIPSGGDCPENCQDGEVNSVWYKINVKGSGILRMSIEPINDQDDFDWVIYDLTQYSCDQILGMYEEMQMSCNTAGGAGYLGTTGINTNMGGSGHCNGMGTTSKWNEDLPVEAGQSLVLCILNWGANSSSEGFILSFEETTANIFDYENPYVDTIYSENTSLGDSSLDIRFNETVECATVDPDDFEIIGPDLQVHEVYAISSEACDNGGEYADQFTLYFNPPATLTGAYILKTVTFGLVMDYCENPTLPDEYPFILGIVPEDPNLPIDMKMITK